jgi:asparagine synthase (glutamine-hydrolysing)
VLLRRKAAWRRRGVGGGHDQRAFASTKESGLMCGIAGIVGSSRRPVDEAVLRTMNDALWHRGPDDDGYFVRDQVGLAMRRLSIIDVAGGRQPIHNEDKSVWVVYNGEIYNHDELRTDLENRGHHFYTRSDTETLVHLYEEYGDEGVNRVRGMFAYALWDERRARLLLARDRLGIKPLYYGWHDGRLFFASELRSFRGVPGFPHVLNAASVERYLAYLYVPGPDTIWRDVLELPPAHYLVYEDGATKQHRYWDVVYRAESIVPAPEWRERFLAQFRNSVKSHLMSEVPLGAFLSGGIDSSAMVAVMAQESRGPVKTFSIGYDGEGAFQDERRYARVVAERYGTEHHEFVVAPDIVDLLPDLVGTMEQPFADSSVIPNYYISKLTRRHVTVALSGLGGDEIGGGYQRYLGMLWAERYGQLPSALRPKWLGAAMARVPDVRSGRRWIDQAKRLFAAIELSPAERYAAMVTTFSAPERRRLLAPDFAAAADIDVPERLVTHVFDSGRADSVLHAAMLADLGSYLPGDLLALADRVSMRHSLEVRVPFLDHPLVELMAAAPDGLKVRGRTKKVLMREAFHDLLPSSILTRRKMGFSVPLALWLRTSLRETLNEILSPTEVRRVGYLDLAEVERVKGEHLSGRANHESKLWALMNLVTWQRRGGERRG